MGADRANGLRGSCSPYHTLLCHTIHAAALSNTRWPQTALGNWIIPINLSNAAERGTLSTLSASWCTLGDVDAGTAPMVAPPNLVFPLRRCSKASGGHAQLLVCPCSRVSPVSPSDAKSCLVVPRLRGQVAPLQRSHHLRGQESWWTSSCKAALHCPFKLHLGIED